MDRRLSPWPAFSSPKRVATLWHARGESNAASYLINACGGRLVPVRQKSAAARSRLARGLEQALQFALHRLVADHDIALAEHRVAAVDVGGKAAGLADHDDARRDVPGRDVLLPVAVESARCHIGEIER